jgi:hypothetical protein
VKPLWKSAVSPPFMKSGTASGTKPPLEKRAWLQLRS